MAIDGFVDIQPVLNKGRIDGKIHDGKSVSEAHAELNAAIGEIFGIDVGQQISEYIFGTAALGTIGSDGSWKMVRFSREGSASNAGTAVGWEFSDGVRRIRLAQISGKIQIWEYSNGSWGSVIDIEADPEYALTQLADVYIPNKTSGLTLKVQGGNFVLGSDTSTTGVNTFEGLTDVNGSPYQTFGRVWESDGTDDINIKALTGKVMIAQYFQINSIFQQVGGASGWLTGWTTPRKATGYTAVPVSGSEINLDEPGVYKVIFGYRQVSGDTKVTAQSYHGVSESRLVVGLPSSTVKMWPPQSKGSLEDDPWWAFDTDTSGGLQLSTAKLTGMFDDKVFFLISSGGPNAVFQLSHYFDMKGGGKVMDYRLSVERMS